MRQALRSPAGRGHGAALHRRSPGALRRASGGRLRGPAGRPADRGLRVAAGGRGAGHPDPGPGRARPGRRPGLPRGAGEGLRPGAAGRRTHPPRLPGRGRADLRGPGRSDPARGPLPHGHRVRRRAWRSSSCSASAAAFIPLVILASVAAGLVWTAAATALGLGSISVVGVGFAAALVGMGVEYGIHGGARYRQLRAEGRSAGEALAGTFRDPGPGIVSSALTTAAGLGALVLAHFRPLRELGQVLTVGILIILVTTATLGAALLLAFPDRPHTLGPPRLWSRFGQPLLSGAVGLSARRPVLVLAGLALLTAVSVWGLGRLSFSTDLRSLRPRDHPSLAAERLLVENVRRGARHLDRGDPRPDSGRGAGRGGARPGRSSRRSSDRRPRSPRRPTGSSSGSGGSGACASCAGFRWSGRRRISSASSARPASASSRSLRPSTPCGPSGAAEDPGGPAPAEWPRWMSELVRTGPEGAAVGRPRAGAAGRALKVPSEELVRRPGRGGARRGPRLDAAGRRRAARPRPGRPAALERPRPAPGHRRWSSSPCAAGSATPSSPSSPWPWAASGRSASGGRSAGGSTCWRSRPCRCSSAPGSTWACTRCTAAGCGRRRGSGGPSRAPAWPCS